MPGTKSEKPRPEDVFGQTADTELEEFLGYKTPNPPPPLCDAKGSPYLPKSQMRLWFKQHRISTKLPSSSWLTPGLRVYLRPRARTRRP